MGALGSQTLEAVLAFAITMLMLSIIASGATEMFHRAIGLRAVALRRMLDQLYDDALNKVLPPHLAQALGTNPEKDIAAAIKAFEALGWQTLAHIAKTPHAFLNAKTLCEALRTGGPDDRAAAKLRSVFELNSQRANQIRDALAPLLQKNEFLDGMTENRVVAPFETAKRGVFAALTGNGFFGQRLGKITVEEFLQRLASGPLAGHVETYVQNLATSGVGHLDTARNQFFDDLSRRFESYGSEITLWFQTRSGIVNAIAGLLIAFIVHADAFVLIKAFTKDRALTQAVIASYEARQGEIDAQMKVLATASVERMSRQSANQPGQAITGDSATTQLDALRADLQAQLKSGQEQIRAMQGLGIPLGWRETVKAADGKTLAPGNTRFFDLPGGIRIPYPADLSVWFGLILGGLLIGLGAPFWYDIVKNLSNVRRLVGAVDGSAGEPSKAAATSRQRRNEPEALAFAAGAGGPPQQAGPPLSRAASLFARGRINPTDRWVRKSRDDGTF